MFKRQINIELVKPSKNSTENVPEKQLTEEDYVKLTAAIIRGVAFGITFTVVNYMACDTVRKVIVNRLSK